MGNKDVTTERKAAPDCRVTEVTEDRKQYLDLLLLGDEQESMIDRYLERGSLFVMHTVKGKRPVAVAVVTDEGKGVCELKNLAVAPDCQRQGVGSLMVDYLCRHFQARYHTMVAGTGESRQTTAFYESCGFTFSHVIANFFVDNYDHPIIEEGKALKDMICFSRRLG